MEGIRAYSRPAPYGGVTIDTEQMLVDLVTVCKAGGISKETFLEEVHFKWNLVKVKVSVAKGAKQ
jgi:hypothetical protein